MSDPISCRIRCQSESEYISLFTVRGSDKVSLSARQSSVGGDVSAELLVDDVRIIELGKTSYGREWQVYEADIRFSGMTVTIATTNRETVETCVAITENHWLIPTRIDQPRDDGTLDKPLENASLQARFTLACVEKPATFDRAYRWRQKGGELTRKEETVARVSEFDLGAEQQWREQVYREIDDFLLLAGLATGCYAQSVGFYSAGRTSFTTHYRRDRKIPEQRHTSDPNSAVVNLDELDRFWELAYKSFNQSAYKGQLYTCLHALESGRSAHLEPSYLMTFAALELIISRYRELNQVHSVLKPSDWKRLQKGLKGVISNTRDIDSGKKRRAIHENVPHLNRFPLRHVYNELVADHGIDLSGIWPLFVDGGNGLASVRNLLVHGSSIVSDERFTSALYIANQHLRWTLEIIVLALIDWPRSSTNRRPEALPSLFGEMASEAGVKRAQDLIALCAKTAT